MVLVADVFCGLSHPHNDLMNALYIVIQLLIVVLSTLDNNALAIGATLEVEWIVNTSFNLSSSNASSILEALNELTKLHRQCRIATLEVGKDLSATAVGFLTFEHL